MQFCIWFQTPVFLPFQCVAFFCVYVLFHQFCFVQLRISDSSTTKSMHGHVVLDAQFQTKAWRFLTLAQEAKLQTKTLIWSPRLETAAC